MFTLNLLEKFEITERYLRFYFFYDLGMISLGREWEYIFDNTLYIKRNKLLI